LLCNQECFVMSPLKNKIIIQKRKYFQSYLRKICQQFTFQQTEAKIRATRHILFQYVRGASKIKLKKLNKKRTVTVRGVIIFWNISWRPLRICLHCCLHQYKTLKAVATAMAVIVLLTPAKNLNKFFWVFLVVSPLFNHYQGYE
jgi:hypothetical protein